ncbi:MAG: F0F1 ATP synthase subunit A [Candidatus Microthrix subdominans]|jgi:F-type H+-transporting ATPase subunit a|nr:F0F1 ATP synthase subunit A [Candidatus Microthrix sp.]
MMGEDQISPDAEVFWSSGFFNINLTLVTTWAVMALLIIGAWLITRRLSSGPRMSRWQNALEVIVTMLRNQIREISGQDPHRYLAFVGTLFLFILVSNLLVVFPGYVPPTASLSTTAALAVAVFVAVPVFAITHQGLRTYLRSYLRPNPFMLPFNIISELSRTLALAVRLFGNVMSFTKIVAILLVIAPLIFPAVLNALGLLTGVVQAYIFAVLATVYISANSQTERSDDHSDHATAPDANEPSRA